MYDAALGRFHVQDAYSEKYLNYTPYHYTLNNPIKYVDVNGDSTVVILYGDSQSTYTAPSGETFVLYDLEVYTDISYEDFYNQYLEGTLPDPSYSTQVARDAHDLSSQGETVEHSDDRYGSNNETPPGLYYLWASGTYGDSGEGSYDLYVGDKNGSKTIEGPDGERTGIAIHQYDPRDSQGCITTCSGTNTQPVSNLMNAIPDLNNDNQPVRLAIMNRGVTRQSYSNPANGNVKFKGTQAQYFGRVLDGVTVKPK